MIKASLVSLILAISLFSANSFGELIAFDLSTEGSKNLNSRQNPYQDFFSSKNDYFRIFSISNLDELPTSLVNNADTNPSDALGIVRQTAYADLFAISDTVNSQNPTDWVAAIWEFDITGFSNLELSMEFAAMGDFESSDKYQIDLSIDGNAEQGMTFITESAMAQSYFLAPNKTVELNDPLSIEDQTLSNQFTKVSRDLLNTGNTLTLQLMAKSDGGTEVFAMQNIQITGQRVIVNLPPVTEVPEPKTLGTILGASLLLLCRRKLQFKLSNG